jgi:hypothetical protein
VENITIGAILLSVAAASAAGQTAPPQPSRPPSSGFSNGASVKIMCDAAQSRLREAGTNQVVLIAVADSGGSVESFKTESPNGFKLEKMKEAADAIKQMRFQPAKKDGHPVWVIIRLSFDCAHPETYESK